MNDGLHDGTDDQLEGELVEGGNINLADQELHFHEAKYRAETSKKLAFTLVILLAASFGLHYLCLFYLEVSGKDYDIEPLSKAFSIWLPVISGLVGASVTYYFTRAR